MRSYRHGLVTYRAEPVMPSSPPGRDIRQHRRRCDSRQWMSIDQARAMRGHPYHSPGSREPLVRPDRHPGRGGRIGDRYQPGFVNEILFLSQAAAQRRPRQGSPERECLHGHKRS